MKISIPFVFYIAFTCSLFFGGANVLNAVKYFDIFGKNFWGPGPILFSILFLVLFMKGTTPKKEFFHSISIILVLILALAIQQYSLHFYALYVTFVMPIMICYCIDYMMKKDDSFKLKEIFYIFFFSECSLSIYERLSFHCLFPNLGFETYFNLGTRMFRSYSLWGHPLSNANIVLIMLCFIMVYQKRMGITLGCYFLGVVSILCFNARFALILSLFVGFIYFSRIIFAFSSRMKTRIVGIIFLSLFLILILELLSNGFGDRIMSLGIYDDASAGARTEIFDIFQGCSVIDFLLPVSSTKEYTMMLNYTHPIVENAWIILLLRYGLIWLVAMILLYAQIFSIRFKNVSALDKIVLIVPFLLNISSTNSLANPTMIISFMFLFQFIMSTDKKNDTKNNSLLLAE